MEFDDMAQQLQEFSDALDDNEFTARYGDHTGKFVKLALITQLPIALSFPVEYIDAMREHMAENIDMENRDRLLGFLDGCGFAMEALNALVKAEVLGYDGEFGYKASDVLAEFCLYLAKGHDALELMDGVK